VQDKLKKYLFIIIGLLLLVQFTLVCSVNIFQDAIVSKASSLANKKIQNNLDQEINKVKNLEIYKYTKKLIPREFEDWEEITSGLKDVVLKESELISDLMRNEALSIGDIHQPEFDFKKLITNKIYAKDYIKGQLAKSVLSLKRDINIVLVTNSLVLLLCLISLKNSKIKNPVKLSCTIMAAVILTSLIYVFHQNWVYTILMNSYYGYFYVLLIFIVILFLLDLNFNKGSISAEFISHFF